MVPALVSMAAETPGSEATKASAAEALAIMAESEENGSKNREVEDFPPTAFDECPGTCRCPPTGCSADSTLMFHRQCLTFLTARQQWLWSAS